MSAKRHFQQARLKREWANVHTQRLHNTWSAFLDTDFCRVAVKPKPDGSGDEIGIEALDPLPAELVLCLGDAVHNLRCSLDYVVAELLGWKNTRLTFPMHESREELISAFRTEVTIIDGKSKGKGTHAAVENAVAGIGDFITNEIKPYKAANNLIWILGKLDARDKHRLLIPVLMPQTITKINAIDEYQNRAVNCTAIFTGQGFQGSFGFSGKAKIESHGKPTAEIFFNEAGIIEGQRVFPTLVQMSQAVSETIDLIEQFAVGAGWVGAAG